MASRFSDLVAGSAPVSAKSVVAMVATVANEMRASDSNGMRAQLSATVIGCHVVAAVAQRGDGLRGGEAGEGSATSATNRQPDPVAEPEALKPAEIGRFLPLATTATRATSVSAETGGEAEWSAPTDDTPEAWRRWRLSWQEGLAARHPGDTAERLAWSKAETAWHRRYGTVPHRSVCGGCGEPIGNRNAIPLGDGAMVHWDAAGVDCLMAYGKRWRGAAYSGLVRLGLTPPDEA